MIELGEKLSPPLPTETLWVADEAKKGKAKNRMLEGSNMLIIGWLGVQSR